MRIPRTIVLSLILLVLAHPAWAETFSWQKPHAKVIPTGELEWAPEPYEYQPGKTVRYIDYADGDDGNPGTRARPWKHHPWDRQARGKAAAHKGPATFVFKGGVIYRGALTGKGAGTKDDPIQLTRDPSWGQGEAAIYGSRVATGFEKGADHPDIPEAGKVWVAELDYAPRCLWMVDQAGKVTRLNLARTPNWQETDPHDVMSQWWTWENPRWWIGHKTTVNGRKMHLGIDTQRLTREPEYYEDAYVWTEWGIVMGSPYAAKIRKYDPKQKAVAFQGVWYRDSGEIIRGCRYYLEDKPHYLDEAGEFWFDKKGRGGKLYLRLPGDVDPSTVRIEAGRHLNLIDCGDVSNIRISGLTFRFTNVFWDLSARFFVHEDVRCAAVRMRGSGEDIRVDHCLFEHVNMPVRIKVGTTSGEIDNVSITDNRMRYTDHGATVVTNNRPRGSDAGPEIGQLQRVEYLRNNLYHIGWRPIRSEHGHAVTFGRPRLAEVAGNFLHRIAGWGISATGGTGAGRYEVPFTRILIHHNRVEDPLLKSNDWGGIETWQSGPFYVYNNVSINPGGLMHWKYAQSGGKSKKGTPRFGHAYYMDGAFKNYFFNNIAWGRNNELGSKYANESGFQEIIGFQNSVFNNTAYKFVQMSRRQAPMAGRNKYMGNIFQDASEWVFRHAKPPKDESANVAHVGELDDSFAYETMAYSRNVLFDVTGHVGVFEGSSRVFDTVEAFRAAAKAQNLLAWDVGFSASSAPLRDPQRKDFRPALPAVDKGVRAFVPWSLYGVVGEWNFTINRRDPTRVIDERWYMTKHYVNRSMYYKTPRYPLTGVNIAAGDYTDGPLEDWTRGAVALDGKTQFLKIAHEDLTGPVEIEYKKKLYTFGPETRRTVDMQAGNFLIEAYLKIEPGHTGGAIVSKKGPASGYELAVNDAGGLVLTLASGGRVDMARADRARINDGKWHHVVAEIDRKRWRMAFYVDGKPAGEGGMQNLRPSSSLSNQADFLVGKSAAGVLLPAQIDFLRISTGTLAEARTTIEELHAWQFDGPFLRDFNLAKPAGRRRDAGAIEHTP